MTTLALHHAGHDLLLSPVAGVGHYQEQAEETYVPPRGVQTAAKRALELIKAGRAGKGFTDTGRARAAQLARGDAVSMTTIKKMNSFFARHAVDRKPDWGKPGKETPGYVAWMAWGGDPGAAWARKMAKKDDASLDDLTAGWAPQNANPDVLWIAGNFVEADNPNSNRQFWTRGDLEMSEYTIRYSPLNIAHRYSHPVGFFADTRTVSLERADDQGSMKIQVLAGMWSHLFPEQAAMVESANASGQLFLSMECTGSHLTCAGDNGCGQTFVYQDASTHCDHLNKRTSIRHIVNPVFRGGALIIPPVRPGWKNASATVLSQEALREAARWVEMRGDELQEAASHLDVREWQALMAMAIQTSVQSSRR